MTEKDFLADLSSAQNYMKQGWKEELQDKTFEKADQHRTITTYFAQLAGFVEVTIKEGKVVSVDCMKLVMPGHPRRVATIFAGGLTAYINYELIED